MKSLFDVPIFRPDQVECAWVLRCDYNHRYFYCMSLGSGPVTVGRVACERFTKPELARAMLKRVRDYHADRGAGESIRWRLVRLTPKSGRFTRVAAGDASKEK